MRRCDRKKLKLRFCGNESHASTIINVNRCKIFLGSSRDRRYLHQRKRCDTYNSHEYLRFSRLNLDTWIHEIEMRGLSLSLSRRYSDPTRRSGKVTGTVRPRQLENACEQRARDAAPRRPAVIPASIVRMPPGIKSSADYSDTSEDESRSTGVTNPRVEVPLLRAARPSFKRSHARARARARGTGRQPRSPPPPNVITIDGRPRDSEVCQITRNTGEVGARTGTEN